MQTLTKNTNKLNIEEFKLLNNEKLNQIQIAYQTHGELNQAKDNAILIFHAMTGSHNIAGNLYDNPDAYAWNQECQLGWWSDFVGPNLAIDTNKYFVICANYLGGCYGSTGSHSLNPDTLKPYGSEFPEVRCIDIVNSQVELLNHLNIDTLHSVIGASFGGLLALAFSCEYPHRTKKNILIGSNLKPTNLQIIHNLEQASAIISDQNFRDGNYYDYQTPDNGLALARMIAHKTYVSLQDLSKRAGDQIDIRENQTYPTRFNLESYMRHQGTKFTKRFDANTYLSILDAWRNFDLTKETNLNESNRSINQVLSKCHNNQFLIVSIDSDVCFYPEEQIELIQQLEDAGINNIDYLKVSSDKGHDSFLIEPHLYDEKVKNFLA